MIAFTVKGKVQLTYPFIFRVSFLIAILMYPLAEPLQVLCPIVTQRQRKVIDQRILDVP